MHPRVCVSGLCFPGLSATDAIEAIAGLGAGNTSVTIAHKKDAQQVGFIARRSFNVLLRNVRLTVCNVVADRVIEQHRVLRDNSDLRS